MIPVILESPYAAPTPSGVGNNRVYARACMLDCLRRGEAPFVSHLLYTQCLNDLVPGQRALGLEAAKAWYPLVKRVVVCYDLGVSPGMHLGMELAHRLGVPIEWRLLPGWAP